jgi:hypothetical protein
MGQVLLKQDIPYPYRKPHLLQFMESATGFVVTAGNAGNSVMDVIFATVNRERKIDLVSGEVFPITTLEQRPVGKNFNGKIAGRNSKLDQTIKILEQQRLPASELNTAASQAVS